MGTQTLSHTAQRKLMRNANIHAETFEEATTLQQDGRKITGHIVSPFKGGFLVHLPSIHKKVYAFLPTSESGTEKRKTIDGIVGQKIVCKILQVNKDMKNIVVSTNLTPRPS